MKLPSVSQISNSSLQSCSPDAQSLVRDQLEAALQESINADRPVDVDFANPAYVLEEIGDYLSRTAVLWSNLTRNVVSGDQSMSLFEDLGRRLLDDAHERADLSDISAAAKADVNITRLRTMSELTESYASKMQTLWRPLTAAPRIVSPGAASFEGDMSGYGCLAPEDPPAIKVEPLFGRRRLLPGFSHMPELSRMTLTSPYLPTWEEEGLSEGDDDEDDEKFSKCIDMEKLRQRGKGSYFCPKGKKCDKGGVDKSGNLVKFNRNSSFSQHCNKHRRPWRCDIPGCPNPPNKRKFARRDGLERHKQTVKHNANN